MITGRLFQGGVVKILTRASATEADDGNGPMHCLLDLGSEEGTAMDKVDHATLIGYVRKHMRGVGIRCSFTLQVCISSSEVILAIISLRVTLKIIYFYHL